MHVTLWALGDSNPGASDYESDSPEGVPNPAPPHAPASRPHTPTTDAPAPPNVGRNFRRSFHRAADSCLPGNTARNGARRAARRLAGLGALLAEVASGPPPARRPRPAAAAVPLALALVVRRRVTALLAQGTPRGAAYRAVRREYDLPVGTVAYLCLGVRAPRPATSTVRIAAGPQGWAA